MQPMELSAQLVGHTRTRGREGPEIGAVPEKKTVALSQGATDRPASSMLPASTRAPWAVETVGEAAPVPEAVQGLMLAEARRAAAEASSGPLTKRINDQRSLQRWKKSEAHANILKYISELGDAVVGRRLTQECEARPIISTIVAELEAMSEWIDRIPPLQQAMRYGNKAFKTWHERLVERSHKMMSDIFERHGPACVEDTALATAELHTYFIESFGSPVRVDYGEWQPASSAPTHGCPSGRIPSLSLPLRPHYHRHGPRAVADRMALLHGESRITRVERPACCRAPSLPWLSDPDAEASDDVLARAGRLARCVGPRRLPVSLLHLWRRTAGQPPAHLAEFYPRRGASRAGSRRLHVPQRYRFHPQGTAAQRAREVALKRSGCADFAAAGSAFPRADCIQCSHLLPPTPISIPPWLPSR
eukprot:scaffold13021_cov127-Isochrysis_galbana.AAC.9